MLCSHRLEHEDEGMMAVEFIDPDPNAPCTCGFSPYPNQLITNAPAAPVAPVAPVTPQPVAPTPVPVPTTPFPTVSNSAGNRNFAGGNGLTGSMLGCTIGVILLMMVTG